MGTPLESFTTACSLARYEPFGVDGVTVTASRVDVAIGAEGLGRLTAGEFPPR
jgi:hypothetical protein